ncbi:MAG: hypothetical protein M1819_007422 [Sarea resinae]|nr:MAG: hypothetical protein M1819_007422 [Sarea resinae]
MAPSAGMPRTTTSQQRHSKIAASSGRPNNPSAHRDGYCSAGVATTAAARPILSEPSSFFPKSRQAVSHIPPERAREPGRSVEYRHSTNSIRDDPFFRSYQSPQSMKLTQELESYASTDDSERSSHSQDSAAGQKGTRGHHRDVGVVSEYKVENSRPMQEITIAVLGVAGVGKSTFIKEALNLRQLPSSPASVRKMSMDGIIYVVRLVELRLEGLEINGDERSGWSKYVLSPEGPCIDGALVLYDVTDPKSISPIPEDLSESIAKFQSSASRVLGTSTKAIDKFLYCRIQY